MKYLTCYFACVNIQYFSSKILQIYVIFPLLPEIHCQMFPNQYLFQASFLTVPLFLRSLLKVQ